MPVLLALVEDESIEVKARGLKTLAAFVERCPAQVLQSTGIGRVFVDVTFPLLLYLPSVTPEDQSITVLSPAYDVLIKLAEYTGNPASSERRRVFDKILRDGVFAGHHHASQHARIVQVLMQKTAVVVNCLGIYSSKHLSVCRYALQKKKKKFIQTPAKSAASATFINVIVYHDRPFCSRASSNAPSNDPATWCDHCKCVASC